MVCCSAFEKKLILSRATAWMNLRTSCKVRSVRHRRVVTTRLCLHEACRSRTHRGREEPVLPWLGGVCSWYSRAAQVCKLERFLRWMVGQWHNTKASNRYT